MTWLKLFSILICGGVLVQAEVKVPMVEYAGKRTETKTKNNSVVTPVSQAVRNTSSDGNQTSTILYSTVVLHSEPETLNTTNVVESTTELSISNAVRLIPDGPIQMLYNRAEFNKDKKPMMEDVEETFTYQVKRQNRNRNYVDKSVVIKSDWANPIDQNKNNEDKLLLINSIDATNKKVDELEKKILTLLESVSSLEKKYNESKEWTNNATMVELQQKLNLLNESYQGHTNVTDEIRMNITAHNKLIDGHIQTITSHLRNSQSQTFEQFQNASKKLEQLVSSVQNTTHEIRMNEVRTRYNQKALTTLDRLLQTNNEKINEMGLSVGPRWAEQTTGCGGVLVAEAGIISYKFRQPYQNNERCIWTIRANRRSRVILQLLEDGFQNSSNSDFITVTEFADEVPVSLVTSSRIEQGNRAVHTFRGPLIFVTFYSDSSIPGNGFTLKFQGSGNISSADALHAVRYRHINIKEPIGHLSYPDEKNVLYQPNEIATFALNPPQTSQLKVHLRFTDLEKEEGCEYDSVNFYGSVMASFALAKKYCEQQQTYTGESLQSSDGTFIIIFRSDASTQFKGFQFSWEKL